MIMSTPSGSIATFQFAIEKESPSSLLVHKANNIATLTPGGFNHTEDTSQDDTSSPANGTTFVRITDILELPSHSCVQKIGV